MIGQTISHYRIVKKIGEGGMGVVYLAEDTHLGRSVAIKFLSEAHDYHYRARFLREARSVSVLSHPNIAIIHDYGETDDGRPFIVMEYIEGETLSELLHESGLTIARAVEIIESVAEALRAAHARGIVHRDIKPSNVLVNLEGVVKVLDFGLAKQLQEEHSQSGSPDANTLLAARTSSNVVVGTPLYLSPEQAQGATVDTRSDLFALGALLYECLTGRPAFAGGSIIDIGAQIIHFNPPPPSVINNRISRELDRITLKMLEKRPEARYQTAGEIAAELHAVRASLTNDDEHRTQRLLQSRNTHSSALKSISETLRQPRLSIGFFAVAMLVVGIGVSYIAWRVRTVPPGPFQNLRMTNLTNSGKSVDGVISPDGKYIVHVMDDGGYQSLWIRQVATANDVQIVPPDRTGYQGLTFSPDGNYVYYVIGASNRTNALYQVSALGGVSRKLLVDIKSPITFSPDGRYFAFVRKDANKGETALIIANREGTEERPLASRKAPSFFYEMGPAWSPDGKTIACGAGSYEGGFHQDVVGVEVSNGTERPITSQSWFIVDRVAWLKDSAGLIIAASEQPLSSFQIWHVSYPGGEARRITNDLNSYRGMSLTEDSKLLVTVQSDRLSSIWLAPAMDDNSRSQFVVNVARAQQITSGTGKHYGVAWSPDGRIVFSSNASGNPDIWIMDSNGTNLRQLTVDAAVDRDPSVSPDGHYVLFSSNRKGIFNIWRIDIDGGNSKQLTVGSDEEYPQCTPDGRWVVYQGFVAGVPTIWKVPIDGGAAVQLNDKYSNWPVISPDGKHIAFGYREDVNAQWKLAIMPFEEEQPTKLFDMPLVLVQRLLGQRIRWSADGRGVNYIDNIGGVSNIWNQMLSGGPPRQLTDFKSDQIFNFAWTSDGKQLACVRGVTSSDIVLISDSK